MPRERTTDPSIRPIAPSKNTTPTPADSHHRVGRPSVQDERRRQIVDAFIELVAISGLEHVSLDDVAAKAGVQRAALRHFVGNRDELVRAAITEITRLALLDLQTPLPFGEVITALFNPARMQSFDIPTRAWHELMPEAMRSADTRAVIKKCYDKLLAHITRGLREEYPKATPADITDTAYAIACMAEHNYTFQRIGYPRARCKGLQESALALAESLR